MIGEYPQVTTEERLAVPEGGETPDEAALMAKVREMFAGGTPAPRRGPGRPRKTPPVVDPNAPLNVPVDPDIAHSAPTPGSRRRRSTKAPAQPVVPVTAAQVSNLLVSSHDMASIFLGAGVKITKEQGDMIGEALIPVLDDWGVVVAGKLVHLLVLVAAISMVEGSVAIRVISEAQTAAKARRSGTTTQRGPAQTPEEQAASPFGAPVSYLQPDYDPEAVARELGIEVGGPA
jgi:hypothetical protein